MFDLDWLKGYHDVGRALQLRRELRARERWPRSRLETFQRERVQDLVRHAVRHSTFYRELYGALGDRGGIRLADLPVVSKVAMMEDFDRVVIDPRLRREALETHLAGLREDVLYLGQYRVMASSGSTGRKGLYVFDRLEWAMVLAGAMRSSELIGVRATLPRRTRVCAINAPDAKHMSYRGAASIDIGLFNTLRLSATQPLSELVDRMNAFQPDVLSAYPSVAAMLAGEQLEGRLRVSPGVVCTSGELRTEDMTDRMRRAWRIEPFDCLGLTELGIAAVDCAAHQGLHVFEDQCVLEIVDRHNRPVPPGQAGEKVLVTSLFRRTQPIIRMEVSDLLTLTAGPCTCGRTLRRISVAGGRSDDVLTLPGASGAEVTVHPIHLRGPLTKIPTIVQYQIVHDADGLTVRVVLTAVACADQVAHQAHKALQAQLASLGVANVPIRVIAVDAIEREAGAGKFKLIKSNVGSRTAQRSGERNEPRPAI